VTWYSSPSATPSSRDGRVSSGRLARPREDGGGAGGATSGRGRERR
jgi:hypothetical protein